MSSFGKKRRIMIKKAVGRCQGLRKKVCQSNPNCTYTKRGCRGRSGTVKGGLVYEGPSLQFGKQMKMTMRLRKLAKKHGIKLSVKVRGRRVYKSARLLKKQLMHKMRKMRKVSSFGKKRRSRFGDESGPTLQQQQPVYMPFFNDKIPTMIPPQWACSNEPDGSCRPWGGPFYPY